MSAKLDKLISGFASKYSLPGLEDDREEYFEWYVDGKAVSFFESAGKIYVTAQVCKLPEGKRERAECVKAALKASLVNAGAVRESLYIDADADTLCLYSCVLSNDMSLLDFEVLLESFMNSLDGMTEIATFSSIPDRYGKAFFLLG